jgi:Rps23 Pro-64 3,4-dihydroxylase Tpa1-like proline 4-hydroxylase
MTADPVLNPALDTNRTATAFARDGRVHIRNVLSYDSAVRVHQCLAQETDFSLLCQAGADQAQAWRVADLTAQKQAELMTAAYAHARDQFHYLYDAHRLTQDGEAYHDPAHTLAAITGFLNSSAFLDLARRITGNRGIEFADAQATRYRPGHFLNQHDDGNDHGRIAAYVLNMTPRWRPDWGGVLLFSDRPGHLSGGYPPAFNALNILSVPQQHLVGLVSPFAGAPRYAITGWFRAR